MKMGEAYMVPICIISFNNGRYVKHMVEQLGRITPLAEIWILDNCSTDPDTLAYLETVPVRVLRNPTNVGPWISPTQNAAVYAELPDLFVLTDPDLELNPNLPSTFLDTMADLAVTYRASKLGLALDISDPSLFLEGDYVEGRTIAEHEAQFWTSQIPHPQYELYRAGLDTTFCLVNKQVPDHPAYHIRIAGDFTAKHLPWYKKNPLFSVYESYNKATAATTISTTSGLIARSIERNWVCIRKNDQTILIQRTPDDTNLEFWEHKFSTWEPETFDIFDRFLDPTKTFVDIGAWIGTTAIYGSRKSKNVIAVEADPASVRDLEKNCKHNDCTNVSIVHKALFNETGRTISIVGNNESVSQISLDTTGHPVSTTSIHALLLDSNVDPSTISLIKVDIEGAEEMVLYDLYSLHKTYSIPLYVSFHYQFFKDKNIDRFTFLTEDQKATIRNIPFPTILFMP